MAFGHMVASEVAHRSSLLPSPLRRGAAVAAIAGSALSAISVGVSALPDDIDPGAALAAQSLTTQSSDAGRATAPDSAGTAQAGQQESGAVQPVTGTDGPEAAASTNAVEPVSIAELPAGTEQVDAAALVKAVQMAEKELTRPTAADKNTADKNAADKTTAAEKAPEADKAKTEADDGDGPAPAAEAEAPATTGNASGGCDLDTSSLGPVKPHVRKAAQFIGCQYGGPTILGVAGRGGSTSDHPGGKALDFMIDRSTGNAIAECTLANQKALGVSYVIWRQRINFGKGWEPMEDRGGVTANHFDHVHVSFNSSAGGAPKSC